MTLFALTILSQHWLVPDQSEGDLCSHGTIRLVVGGQIVVDGEEDYGLSPTALALLRTLDANHTPETPVAQQLVFHGCGLMLMSGCPIGLDWSVLHTHGVVVLSDIRRHDSTSSVPTVRLSLSVSVPLPHYRQQVLAFATAVQQFVSVSPEKRLSDPFDQEQYGAFWTEYSRLLRQHGAA